MVRNVIRGWVRFGVDVSRPLQDPSVADRYRNMNLVLQGTCQGVRRDKRTMRRVVDSSGHLGITCASWQLEEMCHIGF